MRLTNERPAGHQPDTTARQKPRGGCNDVQIRRAEALQCVQLLDTCRDRASGVGKLGGRNEEPDNRK